MTTLKPNTRGASRGKFLPLLFTNSRCWWPVSSEAAETVKSFQELLLQGGGCKVAKVAKLHCRARTLDFRRADCDLFRELLGRSPGKPPREGKCRGELVDCWRKLRFQTQLLFCVRRPQQKLVPVCLSKELLKGEIQTERLQVVEMKTGSKQRGSEFRPIVAKLGRPKASCRQN